MPEYLAPGVYVEEVSFRSKSIEGVSTTTTGFIGPARYGPVDLEPDVITSLGEFERVYGDRQKLQFRSVPPMDNYLWHAARSFFQEGGRRLYVSRVFRPTPGSDGHAQVTIGAGNTALNIKARFPGAAGSEMRVRLTLRLSQNILSSEPVRDAFEFIEVLGCLARVPGGDEAVHARRLCAPWAAHRPSRFLVGPRGRAMSKPKSVRERL